MAAIGKIRSWGPFLVGVIALGLFGFIAGDMFRSCETQTNERRQQVGEVLGQKVSVQEFQTLVDEYQNILKVTQGRDNLSEDELNQVKDIVWNTLVNNKIIEEQAKKLGLTVTDKEMQNILTEGTNPMLRNTPFVSQATGNFDVNLLKDFLNQYNANKNNPQAVEQYKPLYDLWQFIEKQLRQQTLAQKFQSLLGHCLFSNPIAATDAVKAQAESNDIKVAFIPYSSINDNDAQATDAQLKAKYNEQKEMFKQEVESRDIKYVDFQVTASKADRDALMKTMTEASNKLQSGASPAEIVRKAQSQVAYLGLPLTRKAFSSDIASKIDSMAVGQTTAPFETASDNTLNVVKLIDKTQQPDSVEYRTIQVGGATIDEAHQRADSIFNALKGGADFEKLAQKYQQQGTSMWLTSAQYEQSPSIDTDSRELLTALNTLPEGEMKNLTFAQGNVILQVLKRRAIVTKYDVAVIKHTIDFSKDTYSKAYNKFSQFVSENQTVEDMEKNATKFGYKVLERADMINSEHNVARIRATREAMKWIFDAKAGQVSPLYECGNNDHLLVVALTKVHPVGYRTLDDVKDELTQEVVTDNKFDQLKQKLAGVNSIADAQKKGAKVIDINQVTFSAPVYVQEANASEPALCGAVAATKVGAFCPRVIKGKAGAYMVQVVKRNMDKEAVKNNEKGMETQLGQRALQAASRYTQELYQKANVVDNRYLFF